MLTRDGDRLEAFEDFHVDWDLPKHRKPKKKRGDMTKATMALSQQNEADEDEIDLDEGSDGDIVMMRNPVQIVRSSSASWQVQEVKPLTPVPWYKRIFGVKPVPVEPEPPMSIQEFFSSVKLSAQELVIVNERASGYEKALENARLMGQNALVEKLSAGLNAFKMETHMIAMGLTKYVEEKDIVRFYKMSKKGLRLDWVKHYTKTVPEDVMKKKKHADELFIFDNYLVLHYDPSAKNFAETVKEKAARRDPILFGVMENVNKLYYVGDWIDEYCDLTLDKLAEEIGREHVHSIVTAGHPYRETP